MLENLNHDFTCIPHGSHHKDDLVNILTKKGVLLAGVSRDL